LPGNVSSQFITGILLALPLSAGESDINHPIDSSGYLRLTVIPWRNSAFGCSNEEGYRVASDARYR
jgi:3-phosphoshikimate 1-carboxyvinyltransferase